MKKSVLFIAFLMAMLIKSNLIYSQEQSNTNQKQFEPNIGNEVFTIVEVQPTYPGGEKARQKFLSKNIIYPPLARKNDIHGTVYVTFVVEPDGTLSNIKILKGIGSGCDDEVIRVVEKMPKWTPGTQKGKKVRVKINMPVLFVIK